MRLKRDCKRGRKDMDPINILYLVCSVIGAGLFVVAAFYEVQIIKKLDQLKKANKWKIALGLTLFFFVGYIVSVVGVLDNNIVLLQIFNALVYLFGAIFLLLVIMISFRTYSVIFDVAEHQIERDLTLEH